MADVKQIKIGNNVYNIKDYGIRPNVTECYKRLYNGSVAHKNLFFMNAAWPRYHLYGIMLQGYGIVLIGARTSIDTEYTTDQRDLEIHTVAAWDDGNNSYIIKARAIGDTSTANRFRYYGSYHTIYAGVNSAMTAGNPNLVGVWGFF